MVKPSSLFLLRAYGDFTIAVSIAAQSPHKEQFLIVASKHLEPLYTALAPHLPASIPIRFIDFGIKRQLMRCFTNKFMLHPHTLRELRLLRRFVQEQPSDSTLYLEQQRRSFFINLFSPRLFHPVIVDKPVYQSYAEFFDIPLVHLADIPFNKEVQGRKVLILPDSRQQHRKLTNEMLEKIQQDLAFTGATVSIAFFNELVSIQGNTLVYRNFTELLSLIQHSDIVIGGDSLPIHLAQFLHKPHYIFYPSTIRKDFFTPFSLRYGTHYSFEEVLSTNIFHT